MRLAYSIPWAYTPANQLAAFQQENAGFLLRISDLMRVLRDSRLGAYTVIEHFSDTGWHLTEEGAALCTDELSSQLLAW